jgi:predicted nucleotide-binding protein (sugar kinase/HSP70/actin superfamily)
VAIEFSSFKCGPDAPIYSTIEQIVERSGTPYFCFKDLDENKPAGAIKIRVETNDYFLKRYREEMIRKRAAAAEIERQLAAYERRLVRETRIPQGLQAVTQESPAPQEGSAQ